MNNIKRLAALMLAFGFLCCAHAAQATSAQLPLDIKAQFGSIEITDTAYWDSPGSTWFVLIRTPDGVNRLLCYVLENGVWTQKFQTAAAMPPAVAESPPVITPSQPCSATAFFTPLASE